MNPEEKKAALGAENTESGKGTTATQSIADSPGEVNPPRAMAWELGGLLWKLIRAMRRPGITDEDILDVLLEILKPEGNGDQEC